MDINFCILLFDIFFRNFVAFGKEIAVFCGFFNLRISKNKVSFQKKAPIGLKTFFFLNFCLILCQNACNFVQNSQMLCFKSIQKYTFGPAQKYTLVYTFQLWKLKSLVIFQCFDDLNTQSRDVRESFLDCQKLIMIFQVLAKFHFIRLSISDFNQGVGRRFNPPNHLTSMKQPNQNRVNQTNGHQTL